MKRTKSNLMRKYFLSYLLIFSIPVAVLGSAIYYSAILSFKKEIENSNLDKLQLVKELTDRQMRELRYTATSISLDSKLTPFRVQNQQYSLLEAIQELKRYRNGNAITDEILLYYHGDSYIYSSNGQTDVQRLAEQFYKFENWDSSSFIYDINHIKEATIRPAEVIQLINNESARVITYIFPIPYMSTQPYGTGMILIGEAKLTDLIENTLGAFQGAVFIFNEQDRILASKNKGAEIDSSSFIGHVKALNNKSGIYNTAIDHEQYSIAYVRSEDTGWTVMTVMPSQQFMHRVIQMKTIIHIIFSLVIVIGLALAVMLSANLYLPIRKLADYIKNQRDITGHQRGNELELIRDTLDSQYGHNEDLRQRIHVQNPYVREQVLIRLLKGGIQDFQEVEHLLACHEMEMFSTHFYVMLIALKNSREGELSLQQREELRTMLSKMVSGDWIGYGVELIHDNAIAFLVTMPATADDPRQKQAEIGLEVARRIKETVHWSAAIAIGSIYGEIRQINRSFIESMAAMEYKMGTGAGKLLFFDEIPSLQDQISWYSIEEQAKFIQSLKQGDLVVASETLGRMMENIAQKEQSILLLKCVCFEVINTLFRTLKEMNISDYSSKIKSLLAFESPQELESLLLPLIAEVCEEVGRVKEGKHVQLKEQILAFIHREFKSSQINLEQIAEQHQLSLSYVSRFIKEHTGYTFTDYIFHMRLESIKQELKASDKNIKDIITEHGYTGVSTFIDKFKRVEGVTPGEYRRLYS